MVSSAVQPVKVRNALAIGADYLRIHDGAHVEPGRVLYDQRVAVGPIGAVHCKKTHPTVPHMDLQAIAIVFEFVPPR